MLQAEAETTPLLKEAGEVVVSRIVDAARICVFSDDERPHNDTDGLEQDTDTLTDKGVQRKIRAVGAIPRPLIYFPNKSECVPVLASCNSSPTTR